MRRTLRGIISCYEDERRLGAHRTILPAERISQMMDDACPKLVIPGSNTLETFACPESVCCLSIDEALRTINPHSSGSINDHAAVQSGDLDISFFGISPREARRLDPSQYMMLETCWEGFERAGYTMEQLRDSQTGMFIGTSNILAHQSLNPGAIRDLADLDGYTVTGSAAGTMSGRISYHLGLQDLAMTIDAACSSSLVTTHLACTAMRWGECSCWRSWTLSPTHTRTHRDKDLCEVYLIFGETIREITTVFDTELEVPLLEVMWADPDSTAATLLDRDDFAQPALFALKVALFRLWQSWVVTPNFVLGLV